MANSPETGNAPQRKVEQVDDDGKGEAQKIAVAGHT
jgi:hypothetical protein